MFRELYGCFRTFLTGLVVAAGHNTKQSLTVSAFCELSVGTA